MIDNQLVSMSLYLDKRHKVNPSWLSYRVLGLYHCVEFIQSISQL